MAAAGALYSRPEIFRGEQCAQGAAWRAQRHRADAWATAAARRSLAGSIPRRRRGLAITIGAVPQGVPGRRPAVGRCCGGRECPGGCYAVRPAVHVHLCRVQLSRARPCPPLRCPRVRLRVCPVASARPHCCGPRAASWPPEPDLADVAHGGPTWPDGGVGADLPGVLGWRLRSRSTACRPGLGSGTRVARPGGRPGSADAPVFPHRPHGFTRLSCGVGLDGVTLDARLGLEAATTLRGHREALGSEPSGPGGPSDWTAGQARGPSAAQTCSERRRLDADDALTCSFRGGGEGI
jgi:hypothetical protein